MKKIILAGLAFCAISWAETIVIDGKAIPVFVDNTKLLQSEIEKCSNGDSRACFGAGSLYDTGEGGIKQDLAKAAIYYEKACNGGNFDGCINLGGLYYAGDGVAKDANKAKKLYIKACDLGGSVGCGAAGNMSNMSKDRNEALKYFKKACDLGDENGCKAYNKIK